MQSIVDPIPVATLESELTEEKFVRDTNNGSNRIYILTHHNAPNVMMEIGRLREVTFRAAGGGTGKDTDIDTFDTARVPYQQLIVWNPIEREIVGGYRFIKCRDVFDEATGNFKLATSGLFEFSEKFKKNYLPHTIELGRSFVQPRYQPSSENRKGLFSLDNLWDGLGAIVVDNPEIQYLFGKVTMYRHYNLMARDLILFFMNYYFPDPMKLAWPFRPLPIVNDMSEFEKEITGLPYKEGHRILNHRVRNLGENIPPLVNSYMNLSSTMKTFGTALNEVFGNVEETGIMLTISEIYETKKERHISTYQPR